MTQVTSLPLSKELWEAGLRIDTFFFYTIIEDKVFLNSQHAYNCEISKEFKGTISKDNNIPAPSTDELLAVMPYKINKIDYLIIRKAYEGYYIQYWNYEDEEMAIKIKEDTLPEALGKMILWLLNNGYKYEEKEKCLRRE